MSPDFLLGRECGGKSGETFYEAQNRVVKFGSSLGSSIWEPVALNLLSQYCKMRQAALLQDLWTSPHPAIPTSWLALASIPTMF